MSFLAPNPRTPQSGESQYEISLTQRPNIALTQAWVVLSTIKRKRISLFFRTPCLLAQSPKSPPNLNSNRKLRWKLLYRLDLELLQSPQLLVRLQFVVDDCIKVSSSMLWFNDYDIKNPEHNLDEKLFTVEALLAMWMRFDDLIISWGQIVVSFSRLYLLVEVFASCLWNAQANFCKISRWIKISEHWSHFQIIMSTFDPFIDSRFVRFESESKNNVRVSLFNVLCFVASNGGSL